MYQTNTENINTFYFIVFFLSLNLASVASIPNIHSIEMERQ